MQGWKGIAEDKEGKRTETQGERTMAS